MRYGLSDRNFTQATAAALGVLSLLICLATTGCGRGAQAGTPPINGQPTNPPAPPTTVELSAEQLKTVRLGTVGAHPFPVKQQVPGSIDFNEDRLVSVFPPYPGKILKTFVVLGDLVRKDQPLYSIDSPDLVQAESTLIAAAATLELTSKELARANTLYATNTGVSQRELEQSTSDQQSAEGALKAARDAVRVFGKTDVEINQIITDRRIDPELVVRSPIIGQVTALTAPSGLFVQPGNAPAPCTVADLSIKWLLASVPESDCVRLHLDQTVTATLPALPDRTFTSTIAKIYPYVDPNLHRVTARAEIADPENVLTPGMLASVVIQMQSPREFTALPANGVVREGDGTMTAWVTTDQRRFTQRIITPGLRTDGWVQILNGLQPGEQVVTDGAIFLDNLLQAPPAD
jgi:cobalt-zinc-cadmium efflux system membrane fusion protein